MLITNKVKIGENMEQFFSENPYALYFIGLLFLIISNQKNNNKNISKNIILVYIIMSLTNIFNMINLKNNILVITLVCFIDLEIINISNETLITNLVYKIFNFVFEMVNKYKYVYIILINIALKVTLSCSKDYIIIKIILYAAYLFMFIKIVTKIYRNEFKLKKFDDIEKIFERKSKGFRYDEVNKMKNLDKFNMLIEIEDKTYLYRKNSHSSISIEALICKLGKQQKYIEIMKMKKYSKLLYLIKNIRITIKYIFKILKIILKAIVHKNGIKKFIKRGYSTIEMQWIRNAGIEIGYDKVYRRKIYELIYSNIFFKSLKEKRSYNTYPEINCNDPDYVFKMLIIYVYLNTVPTFIYKNNERIKINNIYDYYKLLRKNEIKEGENIVYELTQEELFIFIMGLSGKIINDNLFVSYAEYIEKYKIDKQKVIEIVSLIND